MNHSCFVVPWESATTEKNEVRKRPRDRQLTLLVNAHKPVPRSTVTVFLVTGPLPCV